MKLAAFTLALVLSPTLLSASNLLRLTVAHEYTRTGHPQQSLSVFFWPDPQDRVLHIVADNGLSFRSSSVQLTEGQGARQYVFVWHLRPSEEPYAITVAVLDRDGNVNGSTFTQFYVRS